MSFRVNPLTRAAKATFRSQATAWHKRCLSQSQMLLDVGTLALHPGADWMSDALEAL